MLQVWVWYGFSSGECGALLRCGYYGARLCISGSGGGGTGPPERLVGVFLLVLAHRANDIGEVEGQRCIRDGAAFGGWWVRQTRRGREVYLGGHTLGGCIRSCGVEKPTAQASRWSQYCATAKNTKVDAPRASSGRTPRPRRVWAHRRCLCDQTGGRPWPAVSARANN